MSLHSPLRRRNWDTGLRLLSLDAGGSRGISQLKILVEFMRKYIDDSESDIVHPSTIFDMISGVGSGGAIAILLAVVGLTADQALEEFIKLSTDILDIRRTDAPTRTTALKQYIEDMLNRYGFNENSRLMDPHDLSTGCRLAVPIAYKRHVGPAYILRNYQDQDESINLTIADALAVTLATPPIFSPISISDDAANYEYIAADIILSNPTRQLIAEAHKVFGSEKKVACLLSLGCGDLGTVAIPENSGLESWNSFLFRMVSDGEKEARVVASQMGHLELYHRFSVEYGLETFSVTEIVNPDNIIAKTAAYLEDASILEKIDVLIESLKIGHGTSSLEQLYRSGGETIVRPFTPTPMAAFVMRREPWTFIEREMLATADPSMDHIHKPLIVTGIGGCGKTQIIRKFAQVHGPRFASVFFIDASNKAQIQNDIRQHVRSIGPEYSQMTFDDCLNFLAQPVPNGSRLIVYDNLDDPELDLLPLLPPGDICAVIITSRNHLLKELSPETHLALDVMSEEEAIEVLSDGSSDATSRSQESHEEMRSLAEALGFLPIALTQARSYISQNHPCTPAEYLQVLNSSRNRILAEATNPDHDVRYTSTYAAFDASFEMLPNQNQNFLRLISFLHWLKIPLELIVLAATHDFSSYSRVYTDDGDRLSSGKNLLQAIFYLDDRFDLMHLHEMIVSVQNYSLASLNSAVGTALLQMHPLAHGWIKSRIPEQDRQQYQSAAVLLLALGAREEYTPSSPHLASHVVHLTPIWNDLHINDAVAFGTILAETGMFGGALQLQERVVRELTSPEQPEGTEPLASSLMDLATTYRGLGRLNDSKEHQGRAVSIRGRLLGEIHPKTLKAQNNLAITIHELGDLPEAERLFVDLLSKTKQVCGERHLDTGRIANNLSTVYRDLGNFVEAERLQKEALSLWREILGRRNPLTLGACNNLAFIYRTTDRLSDAETIQLAVMRDAKNVLGERHPLTLTTKFNLAATHYCQDRFHDAAKLQEEVLKIRTEVLGDRNLNTISSSNHLASCYASQGRHSDAMPLYIKVLRLRKELLGESHPDTLQTLFLLAVTCVNVGDYVQAVAYQKSLYHLQRELLGEQHSDTMTSLERLVFMHYGLDSVSEAKPLQETLIRIKMQTLGEQHPEVISAHECMANLHYMTGHQAEMAESQSKVLELRKETMTEVDSDIVEAYQALIRTYIMLGRVVEAAGLQEELTVLLPPDA